MEDEEATLARAIIALGRTLQIETVAEGIERVEQREGLRALGCTLGQGFLFARPMTGAKFAAEVLGRTYGPINASDLLTEQAPARKRA